MGKDTIVQSKNFSDIQKKDKLPESHPVQIQFIIKYPLSVSSATSFINTINVDTLPHIPNLSFH